MGDYCLYNKQLARIVGKDAALLMGFMCYRAGRSADGIFTYAYAEMMDDLLIRSENTVREIVRRLEEKALVARMRTEDNTMFYGIDGTRLRETLHSSGVDIVSLLASSSYQIYNKTLARMLDSTDAAVLYAILASYSERYADERGWFTATEDKLSEELGITRKTVRNIVKDIEDMGILETKKEGLPFRKYYRFDRKKLEELCEKSQDDPSLKNYPTSSPKLREPLPQNLPNYRNIKVFSSLHSENTRDFCLCEAKDRANDTLEKHDDGEKKPISVMNDLTDLLPDIDDGSTEEIKIVCDLIRKGGFRHRLPSDMSRPSSTIMECVSRIRDIASANFLKWEFDSRWAKSHVDMRKVRRLSDEVHSFREAAALVETTLSDLARSRDKDCYPRDKDTLPSKFSDFLYNAHTQKSWFVHFLSKGVMPLEEAENAVYVEKLPEEFLSKMSDMDLHWRKHLPRIARPVLDLADWHSRVRTAMDRGTDFSWLFHREDFWESYLSFVSSLVGDGHPSRGHFIPYGRTHRAWMEQCEDDYGVDWSCLSKVPGENERGWRDEV